MSATYESILQEAVRKSKASLSFKKTYPAYIALAIALIISILAWMLVKNKVETDNHNAFEKSTTSVISRLKNQVDNDIQIIRSMQGLYQGEGLSFVVRDVFELYGSVPVKIQAEVLSVAYAPKVTNINEFVQHARSERYFSYKVRPEGKRNIYFPTFYIVPFSKNENISGFDLASNPNIADAIKRTEQNDKPSSTSFFNLREPDTLGFMLLAHIYKKDKISNAYGLQSNDIDGVVFIEIRAKEFFQTALGNALASDSTIIVQCIDTVSSKKENEVYSSKNSTLLNTKFTPKYAQDFPLSLADRQIILRITTVPNFGGAFQNNLPILTFVGSIITSILIFGFIFSLLTSKSRAEDLAERMTRSQRRIVDTSQDLIGVTDMNGFWRNMNIASEAVLNYNPDEIIGMSQFDLIMPEDREKIKRLIENTLDETPVQYDARMLSKNDKLRWVSWSVTKSAHDMLIYCIGRDITQQKLDEEVIRIKNKQVELYQQLTTESAIFKTRFVTQVSFFFRTSLTGIIGYLQLVISQIYSTPEEMESYIDYAYNSTEELVSRVSDLIDVADSGNKDDVINLELINLPIEPTFQALTKEITASFNDRDLSSTVSVDDTTNFQVIADKHLLKQILEDIFGAFSEGKSKTDVDISVSVNTYEGVVEFQALFSENELVSKMIDAHQQSSSEQMLNALLDDTNDIKFRIYTAMSRIHILSGTMSIGSLGSDGNAVMITLPAKKIATIKRKI